MDNTRLSQKFCNILVCVCLQCVYHINEEVQAVVSSIVVVGILTHCALLNSVYNLKAGQMDGGS